MIKKVLVQWTQDPKFARRRLLREGTRAGEVVQQRAIHREDPEFAVAFALAKEELGGFPLLRVGIEGTTIIQGERIKLGDARPVGPWKSVPTLAELMAQAVVESGLTAEQLAEETAWVREEIDRAAREHEQAVQAQRRELESRSDQMDQSMAEGRLLPMWDSKAGATHRPVPKQIGMKGEFGKPGWKPGVERAPEPADQMADRPARGAYATDEIERYLFLHGYEADVVEEGPAWTIKIATETGRRRVIKITRGDGLTLRTVWREVEEALKVPGELEDPEEIQAL